MMISKSNSGRGNEDLVTGDESGAAAAARGEEGAEANQPKLPERAIDHLATSTRWKSITNPNEFVIWVIFSIRNILLLSTAA